MKELDLEEKPEEKQPPYHVLSRNLIYPGSHIIRFPVPDEKVPWEVRALAWAAVLEEGTMGCSHGWRRTGGGKANRAFRFNPEREELSLGAAELCQGSAPQGWVSTWRRV